jgi:hypothetical protein
MPPQPRSDPFAAAWLMTAALLGLAGIWPRGASRPEPCPGPRALDSRSPPGASHPGSLRGFVGPPAVACDRPGGPKLDGALPILFGGRLDLARADAAALDVLPGVGPALAGRIVAERERAPFCVLAELGRVAGIGARTLARLDPWLEAGDDPRCAPLSRAGRGP